MTEYRVNYFKYGVWLEQGVAFPTYERAKEEAKTLSTLYGVPTEVVEAQK